jgi:hypothetical protein
VQLPQPGCPHAASATKIDASRSVAVSHPAAVTNLIEAAGLTRLRDTVCGGSVIEREVLVDRAHGGGAFANRGGDALHRARPEVADGEQAGPARLERKRATTCKLPTAVKMLVVERQVSEHKAVLVKRGAAG